MPARTLALAALLVLAPPAQGTQEFPHGVYLAMVQAGDGISVAPGTYQVTFDGHGVFQVQLDTTVLVLGAYTSLGDTLQVEDEEGPQACDATAVRASYRWSVAARELVLKPLNDPCHGWRSMLGVRPIALKP